MIAADVHDSSISGCRNIFGGQNTSRNLRNSPCTLHLADRVVVHSFKYVIIMSGIDWEKIFRGSSPMVSGLADNPPKAFSDLCRHPLS